MGFGKRLLKVRETLGMSQREMAKLMGVSERVYLDYEKDKKKPTYEKLLPLSRKKVNLHWLLTGQGEMFAKQEPKEKTISTGLLDRELVQKIFEVLEDYYRQGLLKNVPEEEIMEVVKFVYKRVKPIKEREERRWTEELQKLTDNYVKIFFDQKS